MSDTIRLHFNTENARQLRNAVNDQQKQSIDNLHEDKQIKGDYLAWDRTCAAMDRIEDTLSYLNGLELGKNRSIRTAFDFYDFINNAYIVIDCIKTIGKIFRINTNLIKEIEDSTSVFGNVHGEVGSDQSFFEYIRSLCVVHPLCTNHQKVFLKGSQFHCCPFVVWNNTITAFGKNSADLRALIYTSNRQNHYFYINLNVSQFEEYLTKWIDLIPFIIEAKYNYSNNILRELKEKPVKKLSDFDDNYIQWLKYLKKEYSERLDYGNEYVFDEYIRLFEIKLSDLRNGVALEKYQNAVKYSLDFMRNELQNMTWEGYENNGIQYPQDGLDTTLFDALSYFPVYDSAFAKFGYSLQKMYYLEGNSPYSEFDKMFARDLLEEPKELINHFVFFTNTEPDEERVVLVHLALYLDSLNRKSILNKNIPNSCEFRMNMLSDEDYKALFIKESSIEFKPKDSEELTRLLKKYGG